MIHRSISSLASTSTCLVSIIPEIQGGCIRAAKNTKHSASFRFATQLVPNNKNGRTRSMFTKLSPIPVAKICLRSSSLMTRSCLLHCVEDLFGWWMSFRTLQTSEHLRVHTSPLVHFITSHSDLRVIHVEELQIQKDLPIHCLSATISKIHSIDSMHFCEHLRRSSPSRIEHSRNSTPPGDPCPPWRNSKIFSISSREISSPSYKPSISHLRGMNSTWMDQDIPVHK